MASTVWKGYVTFGLITIPVRLYAAARTERVSFNQIHQPCGGRIKQQTVCPRCDRVVERSELVKGYEVEKDRYVIVNDEEIKNVAPASSDAMEISEFVKAEGIDPIYYDASFFMVPEEAGKKAYNLLLETMQKSGYSAIAKITMHQREYTVVIRPHADGLLLHTMFYPEEVREVPEFRRDPNMTREAAGSGVGRAPCGGTGERLRSEEVSRRVSGPAEANDRSQTRRHGGYRNGSQTHGSGH